MSTRSSLHEPASTAQSINPNPDIDINRPRANAPTPTKLAPFPGVRTGSDDDPFSLPAPKEGEPPPVMITQDTSSPGRTISTMFDPKDQLEPVPPVTPPAGGGETPVDTTVAIDAATIAALSTTPKLLVPVPAGASLEFLGATGAYTYGTTPYTGAGSLQIKCGGTVVSNDVPVTAITGGASGDVTFTALPGITLQADMPITLTQTGGSLTGGDGTLSIVVNTSTHLPPAGDAQAQSAPAAAPTPRSTVGTSLYARKNR